MKIGALTLDLNHLYKPAKDSDVCTLEIFKDQLSNCVSIFEIKRLKGWWPCADLRSGCSELTVSLVFNLNKVLYEKEFRVKLKLNWKF